MTLRRNRIARMTTLAGAAAAVLVPTAIAAPGRVAAEPSGMTVDVEVGEYDGINSCTGTEESLTVPVGTQVEYCITLRNDGVETLTEHQLDSDVWGAILDGAPVEVEPGGGLLAVTVETVTASHVDTATWTATGVDSGLEGSASDTATVNVLPIDPELDVAAASAAFALETTVMVDDGTDTCAAATSVVVEKNTPVRICYTLTNTGDEALNLHDVRDSHIGQIAGPGFDQLVHPGDGVVLTATTIDNKSTLHHVTWEATGVETGTVVYEFDGVNVTVLGPAIGLDMTVMVDDGHDTCGTESQLAVPAGTPVALCYTMTVTGDEPVNYHDLSDDLLGNLIDDLDREVDEGESLVHTEVVVITDPVMHTGHWQALSQETGVDVDATDSVSIEIADPDPTTTTTTVATDEACVQAQVAPTDPASPPPTSPPPTTSPPTAPPDTTGPTTSSTVVATTTTTTTTPSFTSTTLTIPTTGPVLVLPTTSTVAPEPAGFLRPAAPPCTDGDGPDGDAVGAVATATPGGALPATGATPMVFALPAASVILLGLVLAVVTRRNSM